MWNPQQNPPITDPHAKPMVRQIPDTEKIHPVPGFGREVDYRTDEDRELDRITKEYEAEQQRIRQERSRKENADNDARAEKLLAGKDRVYAVKVATRQSTAWLTWTGIRSAMAALHVEMHLIRDGGYTISMPDPSRVGENPTVASKIGANRNQAHRLIDVINDSFGATVATDKQPKCSAPKCMKGGEYPTGSHPVQLICGKHSGHKG